MCTICDAIDEKLPTLFEGPLSPDEMRKAVSNKEHEANIPPEDAAKLSDVSCKMSVMAGLITGFVEKNDVDPFEFSAMLKLAIAKGSTLYLMSKFRQTQDGVKQES